MTGRLTGSNERVITQARELVGQADDAMALSNALGEAQHYLRELVRIIDRLTKEG